MAFLEHHTCFHHLSYANSPKSDSPIHFIFHKSIQKIAFDLHSLSIIVCFTILGYSPTYLGLVLFLCVSSKCHFNLSGSSACLYTSISSGVMIAACLILSYSKPKPFSWIHNAVPHHNIMVSLDWILFWVTTKTWTLKSLCQHLLKQIRDCFSFHYFSLIFLIKGIKRYHTAKEKKADLKVETTIQILILEFEIYYWMCCMTYIL